MRDKWYSIFCFLVILFCVIVFIRMCKQNQQLIMSMEDLNKEVEKELVVTPHKKHIDTH